MIIEDGRGSGKKAEVNDENELVTRSIVEQEIEHASSLGKAFTWDSTERDIDAGDTMLFVQNLSDTPLILDASIFNGSNVVCTWTVHIGSESTTPTGTLITGINSNRKFRSESADAIAYSDETAVSNGDIVGRVKTPIDNTVPLDLTGIILGRNHYVQFTQVTESTSGSVTLRAHFANPS